MQATVVTIGDELLIGQVVNTNAAWVAQRLTDLGIEVAGLVTVPDMSEAIQSELGRAIAASDIVIVTGGLGPTHDDITLSAVAEYFGVDVEFDADLFERIRKRFERRGLTVPESNRTQAMVPTGFEPLPNPVGTAPGLWYEFESDGRPKRLVVLPGVPMEMRTLMTDEVLPRLSRQERLPPIVYRTLLTAGIGESNLQEEIGPMEAYLDAGLKLAYLPGVRGVRLRLTAYPGRDVEALKRLDELAEEIKVRAGKYIYGEGEDKLEAVVGRMLRESGLKVALAESCTGGRIAGRLTDIAGSSDYFLGGVVAYDNTVKVEVLGVSSETIETHGAVSRHVALEMADGVRHRLKADIGLSSTGIMGPGGGSEEKPVGTVWIGYADGQSAGAVKIMLAGDRDGNREQATTIALNLVRLRLLKRKH